MIAGALILIGLLGGYFFYTAVSSINIATVPEPKVDRELKKFEKFRLNLSLLDLVEFKELKIFGESPVQPSEGGKQDLFAPI